ncbi:MAG TPA: histidine phosphatase family protein [Bacillota bacterium]|nr:histidine phosphatase family protein [Bacillota bacterium]HPU95667.1 histidine phosphatase family protein [Bacillota bacterium]
MRHGQTSHNFEGRMQGRSDIPLDDKGMEQAQAVARALRDGEFGMEFDAVYSSPLKRARKTAEIVAGALGAEVKSIPELMEIDCGLISGYTISEAMLKFPEMVGLFGSGMWEGRYPGGQSHRQYENENVLPALRRLYELEPGRRILAVTHGGFIRTAIMNFLGIGDARPFLRHRLDNCGLTTVEIRGFDGEGKPIGRLREMNLVLSGQHEHIMDVYSKEDNVR